MCSACTVGNLVLNFLPLCIEREHLLVLRTFFLKCAGQLLFDLLDGKCFGMGFMLHFVDGLRDSYFDSYDNDDDHLICSSYSIQSPTLTSDLFSSCRSIIEKRIRVSHDDGTSVTMITERE